MTVTKLTPAFPISCSTRCFSVVILIIYHFKVHTSKSGNTNSDIQVQYKNTGTFTPFYLVISKTIPLTYKAI